jgi:UDP-glucose 4-epimerase
MLEHLVDGPVKPARVVVIGSGGFVGGAVHRRLVNYEVKVLALGREELDLAKEGSAEALHSLLRPEDAVVFAAARVPCRDLGLLIENALITKAVIGALKGAPISHLINISSDAVYADAPVPIAESTPTAPTTIHGVMHLAREIALRSELDVPIANLRPTLLYGRHDPHNGYGPNRFCRLAAGGGDIVLFGAGEERRDHVLIDDLAEIVLRVLLHRSIGVLNVATGEVHSFRAIANLISEGSGSGVTIEETPRTGPMPHNGYRPFDIAAMRSAFPDFDYVKIQDGIRRLQEPLEL